MSARKVFCLGFQKTGTSSLGDALGLLGYSVTDYHPFRDLAHDPNVSQADLWARAEPLAAAHDAAQDTPWPVLYRELYAAYPDAHFILVTRERDSWIRSVMGDFANHSNEIHRLVYGSPGPKGHEADWIARYERHNAEVQAFFAEREARFACFDMSAGELNWSTLCAFLGKPEPQRPWPHANTKRAKSAKMFWWRNRNRLRKMVGLGSI